MQDFRGNFSSSLFKSVLKVFCAHGNDTHHIGIVGFLFPTRRLVRSIKRYVWPQLRSREVNKSIGRKKREKNKGRRGDSDPARHPGSRERIDTSLSSRRRERGRRNQMQSSVQISFVRPCAPKVAAWKAYVRRVQPAITVG